MKPTITEEPKTFELYGRATRHDPDKSYGAEIIGLLDGVWPVVRAAGLPHTGINYAVYEPDDAVFAGIALQAPHEGASELEPKEVRLQAYAYWKHVGPYDGLHEAHERVRSALCSLGRKHDGTIVEVYGHWHEDPAKLETEIYYGLTVDG